MERLRRLPFMSGCMAAVLAGIISFAAKADSQTIYIRMAVMMLVFFILGIYVRNTVYTIRQQVEQRKREQELEEERMLKKQKEEMMTEAVQARINTQKEAQPKDGTEADTQDDFEPLSFVQAVRTKAKEQ